MQLVPPGPRRDAMQARAREHQVLVRAELEGFVPVIGLARPELEGFLAASDTGSDGTRVTLGYGTATAAGGPYVAVRTGRIAGSGATDPTVELLARERDRIFDHAGVDEPEPESVRTEPGLLTIDGHGLPTRIRHEDRLWAAQATVPHTLIPGERQLVVVARGVAPARLRLRLVFDVTPLWAAREQWLARMRASAARPSQAPTPEGLEAHEALVGMAVRRALQRAARGRGYPREAMTAWTPTWEASVRAQMRLGGQPQQEAERGIALMVDQLASLAVAVGWWGEYGAAATAETVRYTVFDSEVPSRPAQLLWAAGGDTAPWRAAWQTWVSRRPPR